MTRIATFLRPVPVTATAIAAATGAWLAWSPVAGADTTEPGTVADLVERTSPAVVTILSTQEAPDEIAGMPEGSPFGSGSPFEEFLRRFGMPEAMPSPQPGPRGIGVGSGFVIEDDGYIVTNNHVVDNAETVKVRLADEREFDAEVIGTDPQTDLALIKIDATGLPELTLGDSDALRVGEDVIAVGNPFGLGGTVTRGIVSAMARDINAGPYVDFIQTDAAINRGNSGGPLLNLEGEVIGVNSAIYSPNGGSVGVGFAVPSNTVETVIAQLRDGGSVERGWLGVTIQQVSPEIAAAIGLDDPHGALVADVVADGPSAGKLETGDVILSFDGKRVEFEPRAAEARRRRRPRRRRQGRGAAPGRARDGRPCRSAASTTSARPRSRPAASRTRARPPRSSAPPSRPSPRRPASSSVSARTPPASSSPRSTATASPPTPASRSAT